MLLEDGKLGVGFNDPASIHAGLVTHEGLGLKEDPQRETCFHMRVSLAGSGL